MKPDAFLSFSTDDRTIAERVCADLEADGLRCFFAPRDIPGGEDYADVIPEVVRDSGVLVLVFSASAAASPHVQREVHFAGKHKIPILPLRLDATEATGSMEFFLVNAQFIDFSTRPETQFGRMRDEVRRLLKARGIVRKRTERASPFLAVLTSAMAWTIVAALVLAVVAWMRVRWFNLVPGWSVPGVALQTRPESAVLVALFPAAALAIQYWLHRNPVRVGTLDALFALRHSRGAQWRTAGALVVLAAIVASTMSTPGAVSIDLESASVSDVKAPYVRVRPCTTGSSYVVQSSSRFAVSTRIGRGNPPAAFQLHIEIGPYATVDGVELCEVWVDQRLKATFTPSMDSPVILMTVTGPIDERAGTPLVVFNVQHYRDSQPAAAIKAWLVAPTFVTDPDHEPVPKLTRAAD